MTYKEAVELIKSNNLPADFDKWDLANSFGRTVAHVAARYDKLYNYMLDGFLPHIATLDMRTANGR